MKIVEKRDSNLILQSMRETEEVVNVKKEIPEGYLEVKLSTKGKVGAPSVIHVRNFKVKDIVALSLTDSHDTALRMIQVLNDMIWEDVNVGDWHEKEVEELMLYIFLVFYKNTLTDIPYPYDESDIQYLKTLSNGEERVKDLLEGRYVPRTTINIAQDVDTYDLDDTFKSEIKITNKSSGFSVTFGYVKFSDQVTLRKWIDTYYAEEERKFASIKRKLDINSNILNNLKENPEKVDSLIEINQDELSEYNEYQAIKVQTLTEAVKLISVVDYDGQDVRNLSLSEKFDLMSKDARIDYGMISKLSNRQAKMPFGIKPNVRMINPIKGGVESKPFSFQLSYIFQAMQLYGNDEYDDGYDDEG